MRSSTRNKFVALLGTAAWLLTTAISCDPNGGGFQLFRDDDDPDYGYYDYYYPGVYYDDYYYGDYYYDDCYYDCY